MHKLGDVCRRVRPGRERIRLGRSCVKCFFLNYVEVFFGTPVADPTCNLFFMLPCA